MTTQLDRRSFLGLATAAGVVTAAAPALAANPPTTAAAGALDWKQLRGLFKLDPKKIHLAGLLLASHPKPVRDAIDKYRDELDKDPVHVLHTVGLGLDDKAYAAAEKYLGAEKDSVALTDSTTMGLGIVYSSLLLKKGDDIITTTHDHYSTYEALRFASTRAGATVRRVALYDDPTKVTVDDVVARLKAAVKPETRYVALTWVHSSTGVKLPLRAIADALNVINGARKNESEHILLCVDGVHGFGNQKDLAPQMGCDVFIAGTHKWIWGPRGTGIVWASKRGWQHIVSPTIPTFEFQAFVNWVSTGDIGKIPQNRVLSPGGFKSFEHRWAVADAFALHERIGRERIAERIASLAQRCKEGLAQMKHVKLRTPMDPALSGALVCFEVDGKKPDDVIGALEKQNIIGSTTPYKDSYARFTPAAYNTEAEVDRALAAVKALGSPA